MTAGYAASSTVGYGVGAKLTDIRSGVNVAGQTGTLTVPLASQVTSGTSFGPDSNGATTGTASGGSGGGSSTGTTASIDGHIL